MCQMKFEFYLRQQLFIVSFINIGALLTGYTAGWTAPMLPKLNDPEQSPLSEVTEEESSWIGSVMYLGVVIGSLTSGFLSNLKGRRSCLYLGSVFTIASYSILSAPLNITLIFCARILSGLGAGIILATNIVYVGEIASPNIRGALLSSATFTLNLGILMIYSIGPHITYSETGYVAVVLTLIYAAGVHWFIPESPIFLVLQGREKEARDVLKNLGRVNEIDKILSLKLDDDLKPVCSEWKSIFTVRCNRKALFITLSMTIFQQISGISCLTLFTTSIFEMVGFSINAGTSTIIIGATQILTSFIAPFLIERCGRRVLLLVSCLLCSFSMTLLGVFFYLHEIEQSYTSQILWMPLTTMVSFFVSFYCGLGVVPDTLTGEMFRPSDRSTGSAITTTIGSLFAFVVATTFGYLLSALGTQITFWIYAATSATAFVFVAIFVPETKGKTLFEIEEMLSK